MNNRKIMAQIGLWLLWAEVGYACERVRRFLAFNLGDQDNMMLCDHCHAPMRLVGVGSYLNFLSDCYRECFEPPRTHYLATYRCVWCSHESERDM